MARDGAPHENKNNMRTLLLVMYLCLSSVLLNAQPNLDSLYSVWQDESQSDSSRAFAYKHYIWTGFLFSQPDTAFVLASELLRYAADNDFPKAESLGYQIKGISYGLRGDYLRSLDYFTQNLAIEEQIGDQKEIANSLNNIGVTSLQLGDYPEALNYYAQSLAIYKELDDQIGIARSSSNVGVIYADQGNYPRALDHFTQSLAINEELGNQRGIAKALVNIGTVYGDQEDYPKALDYFTQSVPIRKQLGDQIGLTTSLSNIGSIYSDQGNYLKALDYHAQSLEISKEVGDQTGMARSFNNIGIIYTRQGDYYKALDYYTQSLEIAKQQGDQAGMARSFNNFGTAYLEKGDYPKALDYCQKGYELALSIGILGEQKKGCDCLYDTHKALGSGNKALLYLEKVQAINDSLNTQETTRQLERIELQKQVTADSLARAEKIRLAAQKEKEIMEAKKHKNRIQYSLVALVVFLLAGTLLIMTKINFNPKVAAAIIFLFFILIFEFLLVLLDPYVDAATDGEVGLKIGINSLMALVIFGVHQISEKRLKKVLIKQVKEN